MTLNQRSSAWVGRLAARVAGWDGATCVDVEGLRVCSGARGRAFAFNQVVLERDGRRENGRGNRGLHGCHGLQGVAPKVLFTEGNEGWQK